MCGGIGFKISQFSKKYLREYFDERQIEAARSLGELEVFYWSHRPVLPVQIDKKVKLIDWGNRDKNVKLPMTGWAKKESINLGKWAYVKPIYVDILVTRGYEKGVWFELNKSIKGLLVTEKSKARVYMITAPASYEYQKLTGHNREPVLINN